MSFDIRFDITILYLSMQRLPARRKPGSAFRTVSMGTQ
jgi:hypothetical protein